MNLVAKSTLIGLVVGAIAGAVFGMCIPFLPGYTAGDLTSGEGVIVAGMVWGVAGLLVGLVVGGTIAAYRTRTHD